MAKCFTMNYTAEEFNNLLLKMEQIMNQQNSSDIFHIIVKTKEANISEVMSNSFSSKENILENKNFYNTSLVKTKEANISDFSKVNVYETVTELETYK